MKPGSGHKNWLALLLRWLSGDADRKDERALEALAKDDPFLADAFEGYRSMPAENHAAAVTKLKADLRGKYQKKRRGAGFYVLRAAAIGVVLVAAWLVLQQFKQKENAQAGIAQAKEKAAPQEPVTTMAPAAPQSAETLENSTAKALESAPMAKRTDSSEEPANGALDNSTFARKTESKEAPAAVKIPEPSQLESYSTLDDRKELEDIATADQNLAMTKPASEETAPASAPPSAAMKKNADSTRTAADGGLGFVQKNMGNEKKISGVVTDESGEPLIGVAVAVDKTNLGTNTNLDGFYSIQVPPGAESLTFSYTGYGNLSVKIGEEDSINVHMASRADALSEVVVSGLRKGKTRQASAPEPKGGFGKFEKYVQEKLQYPAGAAAAGIEGEVVVGFRIKKDGTLYDFNVEKSLGFGCDEEAIRLLKEGPKWKAEPGTYASYPIFFKKK